MDYDPNILRTSGAVLSYDSGCGSGLRFLVLTHMGTHSNDPPPAATVATAAGLRRLTPRELDVCVLHLADGWPQATVADWLGLSRRGVQLLLASAAAKVPPLRSIRTRNGERPRRPKVLHLSQIGRHEQGAFDADDL